MWRCGVGSAETFMVRVRRDRVMIMGSMLCMVVRSPGKG
jgi:hypothetical protein